MNCRNFVQTVLGSMTLLVILLPVIGLEDVNGETTSGYILTGSKYHLNDYYVAFREFTQSASVRWYDPDGYQTSSCPVSGSCLVCHFEYSGSFLYKDCYFYIRNQGRELGQYSIQSDGETYYFTIVPYYEYMPIVLR
jgi:hypothetical protein